MRPRTAALWAKQDQHVGDRERLFRAVAEAVGARTVLYPGCYVDVAPSFVWPSVTYVDVDARAARFFDDVAGVRELVAGHPPAPANPEITFVAGDYATELGLPDAAFDLLVSLYAGWVSEACTRYLRVGGTLLVNPSHGDAALASIDARYALVGVVEARAGGYAIRRSALDRYLIPKNSSVPVTADLIHRTGRGVGYTRSPFAYLFERVR